MSGAAGAGRRRGAVDSGRVIRWLLAAQVVIAVLLVGGDFLRLVPEIVTGGSRAPGLDRPVTPGDQQRRYAPGRWPGAPARPGFGPEGVPNRLIWQASEGEDGTTALRLTGEIDEGAAGRFGEYLEGLGAVPGEVALHSPGGSVADAIAIGRLVREAGIATRVGAGDACYSACPYILAGGVERAVSRSAQVGVHQHYHGENVVLPAFMAVDQIQRSQGELIEFLAEAGVDPLLMAKAMQTPPDEIYVLVEAELTGFGLATLMEE